MQYPRVIQQIHQIEITTRCNLRCSYCPHPKMKRPKEDMTWGVWKAALQWVEFFYELGTQQELSFTGIGESTMHPLFCEMLAEARARFPNIPLVFSTNGLPTFTEEVAETCKKNNVQVMISTHRPEMAGKAVAMAKRYGILKYINTQFVEGGFDWAGQVDWPVSAPNLTCDYLKLGWGVILFDGKITTCCLDSENEGVVGTVFEPPGSLHVKPFSLCEKCHMNVP